MINIKTDVSLKVEAQKIAKELGLSLSAILGYFLKELVAERKMVFTTHPYPNSKTRKILDAALRDVNAGKNISGPFASAEEMLASLNS